MRVAIQADHPAWAQMLFASGLKKYAPPGMEVTTHLLSDPVPHDAETVLTINMASCRKISGKRVACVAASHAWLYPTNDPDNWRTRGVNPRRNSEVGQFHLSQADAIVCRNTALERWSSQFTDKARYIPAGIDPELWHPAGRKVNNGKLRVGWCGQVNEERSGHFKGFFEAWEPLKDRLGDRYEFVENANTAATAHSWTELADWMRTIDVFLTTATAEGTPGPPFQAAACGAVVISTKVGQVADWLSLKHAGLVVGDYGDEREASAVRSQIAGVLETLEDPHVRMAKQEMLLASIEHSYSYKVLAKPTLEFVTGIKL